MQSALNNSITKTRAAQMAGGGIDQYIVSKVPDDNQLFNFLYIFFAPTTGSHGHGSKKNQIWKEKIERKKKQTHKVSASQISIIFSSLSDSLLANTQSHFH